MKSKNSPIGRRAALKTFGTTVVAGKFFTGAVSARPDQYGNGNAIGAWLSEKPKLVGKRIWDGGFVDETGESEVTIVFDESKEVGDLVIPFTADPMAVRVSPGTKVTWEWDDGDAHELVSFFDPPHEDEYAEATFRDDSGSFEWEFKETGNYLYYCHPHGTPYVVETVDGGGRDRTGKNLMGHRGAVKVVNK